jgi:hypothetical protein
MDRRRRLMIFTALTREARAVQRAIGVVRNVEVHVIGLRGKGLPPVAPNDTVLVAGLGGALDPALKVGDLVLDTRVAGLPASLPWHTGSIHTAADLVKTPAEKATLFRETGASVVDMEHDRVRAGVKTERPVVGLRAISDPADMALDPRVADFIDPFGRPQPLAILKTIGRRPGMLPHLIRLNSNTRIALRNLGLGAAALVIRFRHSGVLR